MIFLTHLSGQGSLSDQALTSKVEVSGVLGLLFFLLLQPLVSVLLLQSLVGVDL